MPTYEYKCKSCGKMSEFFQAMSAKPMKQCPHCLKNTLERQIGIGSAVMFKGSGFYQTDYRSESYKKAAEAERKSATPAATAEKSADSKPAPAGAAGSSAPAEKPSAATPSTPAPSDGHTRTTRKSVSVTKTAKKSKTRR